jgi:Arc/MetJ-type ribon-helix-helix transcriptional regulator
MPRRTIRLTEAIDERIESAARLQGYSTPSAFLRAAIKKALNERAEGAASAEQTLGHIRQVQQDMLRMERAQQAFFALVDSLAKVVLTCVPEPPRALAERLGRIGDGFVPQSCSRTTSKSQSGFSRGIHMRTMWSPQSKNEILPWWNFFLQMVRSGYKDFETQVTLAATHPAKSDLVRRTVLEQAGDFTLADLSAALPSVSPQLVKKVLSELKATGRIRLSGRGRGAKWKLI